MALDDASSMADKFLLEDDDLSEDGMGKVGNGIKVVEARVRFGLVRSSRSLILSNLP